MYLLVELLPLEVAVDRIADLREIKVRNLRSVQWSKGRDWYSVGESFGADLIADTAVILTAVYPMHWLNVLIQTRQSSLYVILKPGCSLYVLPGRL